MEPNNTISNNLVSEQVKAQTAEAHRALEALPLSQAIVDPALSKEQYIDYLQNMYEVNWLVETKFFPLLKDVVTGLDKRLKAGLIADDIVSMGAAVKQIDPASGFDTAKLTVPFTLGIMYVTEGSTLGGRFILKNITKALGIDEKKGASYFTGYGADTGILWKSFLQAMNEYASKQNAGAEIIAGANYAFKEIYRLMENK